MIRRRGEQGYATVAAVAAIAVFAMMALALVQGNRAIIGEATAQIGQAKAAAAADAGMALALDGLLASDRAHRWSIDGRIRTAAFDGASLTIRIEDERGKAPLGLLDEQTAPALMAAAGLGSGEKAQIAADSLLDWIDSDDEPRPSGAEAGYYRSRGIRPRNGPLLSIDELLRVRGLDAATVDQMRRYVTVHFGSGAFDARFARPEAIGIMLGGGAGNPLAISRQRELDGQRTAIELGDDMDLSGRPLTIHVEALRPDGSRAERRMVIELTGADARPFVVRWYE